MYWSISRANKNSENFWILQISENEFFEDSLLKIWGIFNAMVRRLIKSI